MHSEPNISIPGKEQNCFAIKWKSSQGSDTLSLFTELATRSFSEQISLFRKGQETVAFPERPILSVVEQLDFLKLREQKKAKPKERLVLRARTREAPSRPYLSKPCFHKGNMRYHKASFTKGIRLQTRSIKNEVGPYFKCKELEPKKKERHFSFPIFSR